MRQTIQTAATAAVTAFLVATAVGNASPGARPVPAPQGRQHAPSLRARVRALEVEEKSNAATVQALRFKLACISLRAVETPDVHGNVHPLVKWRRACTVQ